MPTPTHTLFHSILSYAIQAQASDLHLVSGMSPKVRVNGRMRPTDFPVLLAPTVEKIMDEIMPVNTKKLFHEQWEADFAFVDKTYGDNRFRVNVFRQQKGVSAVFRIISLKIPSLLDLNLPDVIKTIALLPRGLALVTGPTGSGKTTTLAAMVRYRNEHTQEHIITIEDPIEFIHSSQHCLITQREVHRDTQSFQQALRSALRADPNVILVGELRDLETIRLALTAAETGHLVLATLHTQSAEKTLHRLIDVFPGDEKNTVRSLLAESLEAVIAQTLVDKLKGGRIAAVEILRCTPAIRHLIREDNMAQIISAMQTGQALGMQTHEQHLGALFKNGIISLK